MKSTQELEHQIRESGTAEALRDREFEPPALTAHLDTLLRERGMTVGDVIVACNLDRSYGYQLFNGTRRPTRDFLLRLALLLRLPEGEAQRLLKLAVRPVLYARSRRDAAVLYALTHGLTEEETDKLLRDLGEEGLL